MKAMCPCTSTAQVGTSPDQDGCAQVKLWNSMFCCRAKPYATYRQVQMLAYLAAGDGAQHAPAKAEYQLGQL